MDSLRSTKVIIQIFNNQMSGAGVYLVVISSGPTLPTDSQEHGILSVFSQAPAQENRNMETLTSSLTIRHQLQKASYKLSFLLWGRRRKADPGNNGRC